MKIARKILAAAALFGVFSSATHAEEGYIRIGESCYINATMQNGFPYLIQVPCPRDVSENP